MLLSLTWYYVIIFCIYDYKWVVVFIFFLQCPLLIMVVCLHNFINWVGEFSFFFFPEKNRFGGLGNLVKLSSEIVLGEVAFLTADLNYLRISGLFWNFFCHFGHLQLFKKFLHFIFIFKCIGTKLFIVLT